MNAGVNDVLVKLLQTVKAAVDEALMELEGTDAAFQPNTFVKTGERGKVSFINEEGDGGQLPSPFSEAMHEQMRDENPIPSFTSQPMSEPMVEQPITAPQTPPESRMPPAAGPEEDPIAAFSSNAGQMPPAAQPEPMPEPEPEVITQPEPEASVGKPPMTRQEFEKLYTEAWGKIWSESGGDLEKAKKSLADWIEPFKASQPHLFDEAAVQASKKVA